MSAGRIRQRATDSGWRVARGDSGHLGADVASHSRLFRLLASLPGISAGLIRQVRAGVETAGLPYTPFLVLGGIPREATLAQNVAAQLERLAAPLRKNGYGQYLLALLGAGRRF